MSNSLQPYGLQHDRPPCPSTTPGVCSNSCPLRWCHPTISSSVVPFSSRLQSFPASGSFQMSQLFESGGQSTGVSASSSVLPMSTQDWSLGWTGWISLQFKGLSRICTFNFSSSLQRRVISLHIYWKFFRTLSFISSLPSSALFILYLLHLSEIQTGFPVDSVIKNPPANAGD